MEDMMFNQLLTRPYAIMINKKEANEPVAAIVQPVEVKEDPTPAISRHGDVTCYWCSWLNHFAKDCHYQHEDMYAGWYNRYIPIYNVFNVIK